MISSYLLSSTVVPVLSVWLLKHHGAPESENHETHKSSRVFVTIFRVFRVFRGLSSFSFARV
jgi:Cu/Ag efflux pump CusA